MALKKLSINLAKSQTRKPAGLFTMKQQPSILLAMTQSFSIHSQTVKEEVAKTYQSKPKQVDPKSILHLDNAIKYCQNEVKKFDFYAYVAGQYMPQSNRSHYYAIHALFLEILKSREISRESSICQTRLRWWQSIIADIINQKKAREPVGVLLADTLEKTNVNFSLL